MKEYEISTSLDSITDIFNEPNNIYNLFPVLEQDLLTSQEKILIELESKFKVLNSNKLKDYVHFQNTLTIPIQRWFPYREGYSKKIVIDFLKEFKVKDLVFDPFCGSGTTLLAARQNNLNSIGMDVNPISVLVSKVENEKYSFDEIQAIKDLILLITSLNPSSNTHNINFNLANKLFNDEILQFLLQFKEQINLVKNSRVRDLAFAAWLSLIESVSNFKKEGNGLKYKNRKRTEKGYIEIDKITWENDNFPDNKFDFIKEKFILKLNLMLEDITEYFGSTSFSPKIIQGDCLKFKDYIKDEIGFTFFSPPYCNCFDYFEIHKAELWLGDFVSSKEEFNFLRQSGLRSNTNAVINKSVEYKNAYIEELINLFDYDKLWNKRIPQVVRGYFDDMHTLLNDIFLSTKKNGYVCIVVGNSAYSGVIIPTDLLLANIALDLGFKVINIGIARHLTTSSQQKKELSGLKYYLRESIVVLQK